MQGILYPSGGGLSQATIIFIILIGVWSIVQEQLAPHRPFTVKMCLIFFLIQVIYFLWSPKQVEGVVNEAIGVVPTIGVLKNISMFFTGFFIFYHYTRKRALSTSQIAIMGLLFFILSIIRFFFGEEMLREETMHEENVNNAAYLVLATIPFIPFIYQYKKLLGYIVILGSVYLIIMGSKRGAVVALFTSILIAFLFYLKELRMSFWKSFFTTLVFLGILAVAYYSYLSNDYLQERVEQTQEIGIGAREMNYQILWNHWLDNSSIPRILLGNGFASSVNVCGNFAHNDWLELLTNMGLLGVLLYAILIGGFIGAAIRIPNMTYRLSFSLFLSVWICRSIFSMGYCSLDNFTATCLAGIVIGTHASYYKNFC